MTGRFLAAYLFLLYAYIIVRKCTGVTAHVEISRMVAVSDACAALCGGGMVFFVDK